ncbi:carbon-nitrogen hydrolase [Hazenella sp. IB182357]|uniref:Carbon-nitrogen hydrolase n=1 Tax=Polycladospora coralii TaxID=2771432 RepID=A0A926NE26_9BACL|nr:nitrilase-related carbon-nitrogen hydrolase [Polycladospora coralii]MBD1371748.1 carbon-nitrogen hydrolase [Polycladospora coralii]MBS7529215.1 acyltransferase [Polycladospora coralii]
MRVAIAQIRPRLGRVDENLALHEKMIRSAQEQEVDLIVFPELSLTGYNLLDLTYEVARDPFSPDIQSLVNTAGEMDVVFGFVESTPEHNLYNSAVYVSNQQLNTLHRKIYLPTYGMFDEARYFGRGDRIHSFPTRFGAMGLLICEDMWHASTSYILAQDGAQMIIVLSNSPGRGLNEEGLDAQDTWYSIMKNQALLHGSYILFANRVGTEDGVTFFGGSAVMNPHGVIEKTGALFKEELLIVDIDFEKVKRARYQMPMLRDENRDLTIRELQRIQRKYTGEGIWR